MPKLVKLATTFPELPNHHYRVSVRERGNQFKHDHWTHAPRLLYVFQRESWKGEIEFKNNLPETDPRIENNIDKLENFSSKWWQQDGRMNRYGEDVELAIRDAIATVDKLYTEKFENDVNEFVQLLDK